MMNVSKFNFNPTAMGEQSANCEFLSSDLEPLRAPLNLSKDKLLGNNSLAKKFSETFSKDLKSSFISCFCIICIKSAFDKGKLSHSKQQGIMKLIKNKGKDKRLIQNWIPISLSNLGLNIFLKLWPDRLKSVSLFSSNQTANEGGRLVADILHVADVLKIKRSLVTIYIQKRRLFILLIICF